MKALDDALEYLKEIHSDPVDQCGIYATAELAHLRLALDEARKVIKGLMEYLDDNGWGKDECVCDDNGDPSVGIPPTFCDYHRAFEWLNKYGEAE